MCLRVEFLLKTDSGYPKDTRVTLFTPATPGNPLRYNTHRSAPPVSALAHSRGPFIWDRTSHFFHFFWNPHFFWNRKKCSASPGRCGPEYLSFKFISPPNLRSDNYWSPIPKKTDKRRIKRTPLKNYRPEKEKIWGTVVRLLWRAAAPGLKPLHLPLAQSFSLDQVLACTESATSEYWTTSHCLRVLLGRPGRVKFILNGLRWKKNQRTYHSYMTTAWWLSTLRCNLHGSY